MTPNEPSSDIPLWMVMTAAGVALALAGLLGLAIVRSRGGDEAAAPPPRTQRYPAHWNHTIAPYARIAARERGLAFRHAVPVHFLSPAAFRKKLRAENKQPTKADRREIQQETALLRAFGLLNGKADLLEATHSFSDAAVLAYYSFRTKSITVRGHRVTPAMKSTLVHELTHVLQDQHFHVGGRLRKLQRQAAKGRSNSKADVLDAIVEGDAERVEGLYRDSLPAAQQKALDAGQRADARQAQHALAGIPKIVVTELTSPYSLGIGLTRTVAAGGGNAAVNRLLRHPPTHETALLDPFRVLAGRTGAARLATPRLGPGEQKLDAGEFGVLTWYLMLAARIPAPEALAAADGWGGDAYVAFRRGGDTCARMTFAGITGSDTARMQGALQQWAAGNPGQARVSMVDGRVSVESCDPGTAGHSGNDASDQAIALLTTRTALGDSFLRHGAAAPQARCLAGRLVDTYTVAQLSDPTFGADDPTVTARVQQLGAECR